MADCTGCGARCTVTCGYSCSGTLSTNAVTRVSKVSIPMIKKTTLNNSDRKSSMIIKKSR